MTFARKIPQIGFGTFGRDGAEGVAAIAYALEVGYRHIDTAQSYGTETQCGEAISASGVKPDDIFVTTKITMENYGPGLLVPSLRKSLDNLKIDCLDLTLIHWPAPPEGPMSKAIFLEQLVEAQALGLTRLIGVSNFTTADIDEAQSILGPNSISCNQFELHAYLQNRKLADHCLASSIAVTCYCPLGQGLVVNDPVLVEIGKKHNALGSQVALAFLMAKGYAVIPTSGKHERIKSNFESCDIQLSTEDIGQIEALDRKERVINPDWGPDWD